MDNLASSMHCGFSRNSNSVLNKNSGEISVELHPAVQKVWPNTNFIFPLPKSVEATGVQKAAVFVQGIETAESNCWYPELSILALKQLCQTSWGWERCHFPKLFQPLLLLPSYAASI